MGLRRIIIQNNRGNITFQQLQEIRVVIVGQEHHNPVHPANPAILQITALLAADILGNEHQRIAFGYRNLLEALNHRAEKWMADTRPGSLHKQHTDGP
ncbi:hypothetical protein D3C75_838840 [compost metagenome]